MKQTDQTAPVAVLIEDVYFMSIIASAANKRSTPVRFLSRGQNIPRAARLLLVDLEFPGEWEELVAAFVSTGGVAIGFGPHVDAETRLRAKNAGCNRVLAKSRFVQEIGDILATAAVRAG